MSKKYVIALYIRLSIDDKTVESMSIESQQAILRKFVETLGIDNIEIIEYIDNGYTGTNFERPSVQRLLEDVKAFKIDCIMVKDFSRFGRNSIEVGYFTQQVFPLYNVRFISVGDYFDSDDHKGDTGGMAVTFKYLVNEYYSRDLSMKVKSAKDLKMRKGEYVNGVYCYGYKRGENGEMVVNEDTADVVRLIYTLASEGNSTTSITRELHLRNIPTPAQYKAMQGKSYDVSKCKHWDKTQIIRILSDEQYLGTYIMGKRTVLDVGCGRTRVKDESEWYKIPNHHEAIISQELFNKVQATRRRATYKGKTSHTYPLKGKVICGCCNHHLQYHRRKRPSFNCDYTKYDETEPCYNLGLYEEELHAILFDVISRQAEIITNIDSLNGVDKIKIKSQQTIEIEKQITACQKSKQNLYEQLITKQITLEEYQRQKGICDADMRNYQTQYDRSSRQLEQAKADSTTHSQLVEIAKKVKTENTLTQSLSDMLIDKVFVYPDKRIEIVWKIKDFCMDMAEK